MLWESAPRSASVSDAGDVPQIIDRQGIRRTAACYHAHELRRNMPGAPSDRQDGCAMACGFGLTGKMGLVRNLTAGEIAGQVRVLANATHMLEHPFNIVLMGMGEPLHNYDPTMKALRILHSEHGLAVSPRRVT